MPEPYAALSHAALRPAISYQSPPTLPERVYMDSPALDVMTDFAYVRPVTVKPHEPIDAALEHMKTQGVRLLLVTDERERILGIVSSYDIQGERPVQLSQESRIPRAQIEVGRIMTAQRSIEVVNFLSVLHAQVGQIVATLRALELRHLLVVEIEGMTEAAVEAAAARPGFDTNPWGNAAWQAPPERSGRQWVRGLFSATRIGRQLHVDIGDIMTPAHSLAEMVHERA